MVYFPSNGAPTLSTEIAVPACSFGFPPGHALELGEGTGDLLGDRSRSAVDFGLGPVGDVTRDVHRIAELLAMSTGLTAGSTALVVVAGAVATNAFFCARSQPRACTSLTCSAAVIRERNRSRSVPRRGASGFSAAVLPPSGAVSAFAGCGSRTCRP